MLKALSIPMGMMMGLLRQRTTYGAGASGFELMLAPSQEDPGRYAIESVRGIDQRTAHRVLGTFALADTPSLVPPGGFPGGEERDQGCAGEAGSEPRITFIRLTPRQALSMLGEIRRRYCDVRKLYAHLEAKELEPIGARARGAVMRAYAADGVAHGEGIVLEVPHRGEDGAQATFRVSIREWMDGGDESGEVTADCEIRRGERVETYEMRDGRVCIVEG